MNVLTVLLFVSIFMPVEMRLLLSGQKSRKRLEALCLSEPSATFIRVPTALFSATPSVTGRVSVDVCAELCLNNTEPATNRPMLCRGFNFQNHLCHIFDANAQNGEIVHNLENDYYFKKVCLDDARKCRNRTFAFDLIQNSQLLHVAKSLILPEVEQCLQQCLDETEFICHSVNYDKQMRKCHLSAFNRRNQPADFRSNVQGMDYYENNCLTGKTRCMTGRSHFIKTLHSSLLPVAHHSMQSIQKCLTDCLESENLFCRSVEFDRQKQKCYLSDRDTRTSPHLLLTAQAMGYDLFEPVCLPALLSNCDTIIISEKLPKTTFSPHHDALLSIEDISIEHCLLFCVEHSYCRSVVHNHTNNNCVLTALDRQNTSLILFNDPTTDFFETACPKGKHKRAFGVGFQGPFCGFRLSAPQRQLKTFARNDHSPIDSLQECQDLCESWNTFRCRSVAYSSIHLVCSISQLDLQDFALETLTVFDTDFAFYERKICSPEALRDEIKDFGGENFTQTEAFSHHNQSGGAYRPEDIDVQAICSNNGATVTVKIKGTQKPYSGAIYAAERFSYCRQVVENKQNFTLFLPRPSSQNNTCNALEENGILSAIIIVSNDQLLPYDMTTKEDLFYQITCDYASHPLTEPHYIKGGLVVGGPHPRVVDGRRELEIDLRILRNGEAVENVLLGEQLTLSIESRHEPNHMNLVDCNVTRIGGNGPAPEPLSLLRHGCPTMSQILGPFSRSPTGVEAPLTAFRIDGSSEIQIVCMVLFCNQQCQPTSCSERRKRELRSTESRGMFESVDGRLRVYVQGEDGAPSWHKHNDSQYAPKCTSTVTFLTITGTLACLLFVSVLGFGCTLLKQQHKLLLLENEGRESPLPYAVAVRQKPAMKFSDELF